MIRIGHLIFARVEVESKAMTCLH